MKKVMYLSGLLPSMCTWNLSIQTLSTLKQWFTKIAEQFGGEYDGWGCMAYAL